MEHLCAKCDRCAEDWKINEAYAAVRTSEVGNWQGDRAGASGNPFSVLDGAIYCDKIVSIKTVSIETILNIGEPVQGS